MSNFQTNQLSIDLPAWIEIYISKYKSGDELKLLTVEDKMRFVVSAAEENISQSTGGPFAAAVFDIHTNQLISLGVNLVTSQNLSVLHAEMVAFMLAQRKLGVYDLGANANGYMLVTSSEPCAMCLGATVWSGVQKVICGAKLCDAEAIGFDEGPVPSEWKQLLRVRGIDVESDVLRDEARSVLNDYQGMRYNASANKLGTTK